MGFSKLIRSGIAIENKVTGDVQVPVQHYAWIEDDDTAAPVYADSIVRMAVVDMGPKAIRTKEGVELVSLATVTLLEPPEANLSEGREGPVDPRDKFELPNGTVGKVLFVGGVVDPLTGFPYAPEVAIG